MAQWSTGKNLMIELQLLHNRNVKAVCWNLKTHVEVPGHSDQIGFTVQYYILWGKKPSQTFCIWCFYDSSRTKRVYGQKGWSVRLQFCEGLFQGTWHFVTFSEPSNFFSVLGFFLMVVQIYHWQANTGNCEGFFLLLFFFTSVFSTSEIHGFIE